MRTVAMIEAIGRIILLLLSVHTLSTECQQSTGNVNNPYDSNLLPRSGECGISISDKIYGGQNTDLGQFPWMALLEYRKPKGIGAHCGGVLISKRYVLTAAHCISGKSIPKTWRLTTVRLGEWDTTTDPDCNDNEECAPKIWRVPIESYVVHDSFQSDSQTFDIALLRLNRNIQFNDYVSPICLPNINPNVHNMNITGRDMYVAGWGKTETASASNVLQVVRVPVVESSECKAKFATVNIQLVPQQFCAGGRKGRDACQGDSGGPLMYVYGTGGNANWYAIGVVNFGPSPCALDGWPGVYTRISSFSKWISENIVE